MYPTDVNMIHFMYPTDVNTICTSHLETSDLIFMYSMNVNTVGSQCVHSIL
jgi:hypothetical protein